MFCTKCGYGGITLAKLPYAMCENPKPCGYQAFVGELDYSFEQMFAFVDAARALDKKA